MSRRENGGAHHGMLTRHRARDEVPFASDDDTDFLIVADHDARRERSKCMWCGTRHRDRRGLQGLSRKRCGPRDGDLTLLSVRSLQARQRSRNARGQFLARDGAAASARLHSSVAGSVITPERLRTNPARTARNSPACALKDETRDNLDDDVKRLDGQLGSVDQESSGESSILAAEPPGFVTRNAANFIKPESILKEEGDEELLSRASHTPFSRKGLSNPQSRDRNAQIVPLTPARRATFRTPAAHASTSANRQAPYLSPSGSSSTASSSGLHGGSATISTMSSDSASLQSNAAVHAFLTRQHPCLASLLSAFSELGVKSQDDLDALCAMEHRWEEVKSFLSSKGMTLLQWWVLQDAFRERASNMS